MVTLRSSDGGIFEVNEEVVRQSPRIMREIENNGAENEILLPFTSAILSRVIKYCRRHVKARKDVEAGEDDNLHGDALVAWDHEFVDVRRITLHGLMMAAEYLEMESLLDLTIQAVVEMAEREGMSYEALDFLAAQYLEMESLLDLTGRTVVDMDQAMSDEEIFEMWSSDMLAEMELGRMVTLRSSDGVIFQVNEVVALQSPTIMREIENNGAENEILLPLRGAILSMVIEYCRRHMEAGVEDNFPDDALMAWDLEFVDVDQDTLFDLIMAAQYLNIQSLLDLTICCDPQT